MNLSNSNPEQSQENPKQSQEKKATNKPAKNCKEKFYSTIGVLLFIEAPQIASAWITLAEKMPLLQSGYTQVIEKVLKISAK